MRHKKRKSELEKILEEHENVDCDFCCFNLKGCPKIIVDNNLLCYWCAKHELPRLIKLGKEFPIEPDIVYYSRDSISWKIIFQHYDRNKILERDDYTCQTCGFIYKTKDLEVHHIKTRNDGGEDHPENLITLCKYCHDREDWFGHVRIDPSTRHLTFEQWSNERSRGFNEERFDENCIS